MLPMKCMAVVFLTASLALNAVAQTSRKQVAAQRADKAAKVFATFAALGRDSLPFQLFQKAKAVAVFGDIRQQELIYAKGIRGKGIMMMRRGEDGWHVPTFVGCRGHRTEFGSLKWLTTEKVDGVFLFMGDEGLKSIRGNKGFKSPRKKLTLGPIVKGSGADQIIENAWVIYYTFKDDKLSGEEFPDSLIGNLFLMSHDNAMNKAIYGKKFKRIQTGADSVENVPVEVKVFSDAINSSSSSAASLNEFKK